MQYTQNTFGGGRIIHIDYLKAFAIILVVVGHVIQFYYADQPTDNFIYRLIYSFHMPLFMLLSGYFAHTSLQSPHNIFFYKKTKELLLPCISWSLLLYPLLSTIHFVAHHELYPMQHILIFIVNNFWFLKSCFICYIVCYFIERSKKTKNILYIFAILLSQTSDIYNINTMLPCFVVGLFFKRYHYKLQSTRGITSAGILLWFLLFAISEYLHSNGDSINCGLIKSLMGCSLAISLFYISQRAKLCRFEKRLVDIGSKTLGIYILQDVIVSYTTSKIIHFESLHPILFYTLLVPIITVVVICMAVSCINFIHRDRRLSIALLGK